jgi:uncharacterized protein (DUF3084 family)
MDEVNESVQRLLATRRAWQDVREGVVECPWGHYKGGQRTRQKLSKDEKARRQILFDDRMRFYFETEPWEKDKELKAATVALEAEKKNLADRDADYAKKQDTLYDRQKAVTDWEGKLKDKEAAVIATAEELNAREKDLLEKMKAYEL